MREIVQGVVTWPSFSEPHGYDFNGYFLRHPTGNLCIDPVDAPEDVLALLGREGVARILITNRNHVRKAMLVRERSGARVAIHPDDAAPRDRPRAVTRVVSPAARARRAVRTRGALDGDDAGLPCRRGGRRNVRSRRRSAVPLDHIAQERPLRRRLRRRHQDARALPGRPSASGTWSAR